MRKVFSVRFVQEGGKYAVVHAGDWEFAGTVIADELIVEGVLEQDFTIANPVMGVAGTENVSEFGTPVKNVMWNDMSE